MTRALPLFHAVAGQPVIVLGEGEGLAARLRLVEKAGAIPVGEECGTARLAFVALAEPETVVERLRARGVLVNAMDRPDLCDFTVPSLLERGPMQVAVGTGGVSAGLAKALRLRLEALLPSSLGDLARELGASRPALRARFPDAGDRRRALDDALAPGGVLDPLAEGSAGRVSDWMAGSASADTVASEIRLRSGDPDDLTLREARLLGSADLLIHDPAVPPAILARARADAIRRVVASPSVRLAVGEQGLVVVLLAH